MEAVFKVLGHRKKFIILFALLTAIAGGGLSFVTPLKYSASIRLLLTQRAAFTLDPYTAIRSTELIGENLAQLVNTKIFFDRVLETGYKIDRTYFDGKEERAQRRLWAQTIDADQIRGTGLLQITAYHPKKDEALKIVGATAFLLSTQGSEYVGRDINVRLVDPPLASRYPVKPNVPLNAVAGAFVGALLSSAYVWVDHRRRKHHGQLVG